MPDYNALRVLHDPTRQYDRLCSFPRQAADGLAIGNALDLDRIDRGAIRSVVIAGMGGSAMGGDVLRTLASRSGSVPVAVSRSYTLPAWVSSETLVILISYSGATEETLSAYADARRRNAQAIAICTGGALGDACGRDGVPCARVPAGLAPRFALGYLLFTLVAIARRLGVVDIPQTDIDAAIALLEARVPEWSDGAREGNPATAIAERLQGRLPVLYGPDGLDCVLTRWRCQIEENAKTLAYANVLPEMNHNEIVGWEKLPEQLARIAAVFLHEAPESPRIALRGEITRDIVRPLAADVIDVRPASEGCFPVIMELISLGDWVSFYLAIGGGTDPFPIRNIDVLKTALAHAPPQ